LKSLTDSQLAEAADKLGVGIAEVKAVAEVESAGNGFLPDGRPKILFERHVMRRQMLKRGIAVTAAEVGSPDLVNGKPGGYSRNEHDRLARAVLIDRDSALESCSWGAYQIMGYHWSALGYDSLQQFVNAMYKDSGAQLDAFVRFIKLDNRLLVALRSRNWAEFARIYNGPAYQKNKYDTKLAAAFAKHSKVNAQ
jgi:hypothetical protein